MDENDPEAAETLDEARNAAEAEQEANWRELDPEAYQALLEWLRLKGMHNGA
jgi:hypothetical protein